MKEPTMTANTTGGSATIYTFPPRGRFAMNGQHEQAQFASNPQLPRGVKIAYGSSWYHEEAIQESLKAEHGRKN
jgi:Protein of unknown function (DUF2735)